MNKRSLKIKPHADAIRAQLDAMPVPGILEVKFPCADWHPSHRFYCYHAEKTGRVYSVREHKNRTYVFRLE